MSMPSPSEPNRYLDRLIGRLERYERLDAVSEKLTSILSPQLSKPAVRSLLSGTPIGHPLHPALVLAPVGTWSSAMVLDLLPGKSRRAAQRLIGLGILTALPAAAAGATDWMYTDKAERRVGLVHAGINTVALVLYTRSWLDRRQGRQVRGVLLSTVATSLMGASGWLGGHLSYARGVGVDTTAFMTAPADWVDVLPADELAEGELSFGHAGSMPVLLVRRKGAVTALADRCTHRGGPLHEGQREEDCVVCPWHQATFDLADGSVMVGPATRPLPQYETRIENGIIQVRRFDEPAGLRTGPVA